MPDSPPTLVLDEKLFFLGIRFLADLEGEEEKFELLNVVTRFTKEDELAVRFLEETGQEITADDRKAIDYYVSAVYLVYHHRGNLQDLDQILSELTRTTAEFVRTAAWAFLSAWNFRYGGVYSGRVVRSTLIDPKLDP
jgi:hypothetical protein